MSNRQFLPYGLTNTIDHCLDIVASTICSSSSRMEIESSISGQRIRWLIAWQLGYRWQPPRLGEQPEQEWCWV